MASRAILSIHCEPQETDACRRFGGVSVSISASHGRVQNSWRQAFRFIKLTSTAAYGVLKVRSFTLLAESTPTVSQSLSVYKWWLKMGRLLTVCFGQATNANRPFCFRPHGRPPMYAQHLFNGSRLSCLYNTSGSRSP